MFEIEMLPAREGDCLWLRYGEPNKPRQILIDAGRATTASELKARFRTLRSSERRFELLVVSHVDRDHIEGVLPLLTDKSLKVEFADVWFNGFHHLQQARLEKFGPVQGERLSASLVDGKHSWNKAWKSRAVCLAARALPTKALAGGMRLTLLSPDRTKLTQLIPVWEQECKKAGLIAGIGSKPAEARGFERFGGINIEQLAAQPFEEDAAEANGSSIAVLATYAGKKVLLAADAHPGRLSDSIKAVKKSAKRLRLDAFKLPHHGSEHNISKELLKLVDCRRFLVSTNGSYFAHPTAAAIARVIKFGGRGATICFNYRSKYTEIWDNAAWKSQYGYETCYPTNSVNGTLIVPIADSRTTK